MIVLNLRRLIISLCLIILSTAGLVITGIALEGGPHWYNRLDIQNFLFWGIAVLIIHIWLALSLILSNRKILSTVKRISSFDDFNSSNAKRSFRELGRFGEEMRMLLKRENELAIMRAGRISALNSLVSLLAEGYSESLMVTDISGKALTVSGKLQSRLQKEKQAAVIDNILDIRPDLKLSEIIGIIEKQRTEWKDPKNPELICTPVFDKNGTIQFCVWEFETNFLSDRFRELNLQKEKIKPSYRKLRDIMKNVRKRPRSETETSKKQIPR